MIKDKFVHILAISDIHFGEHKNSELLYYELKEIFIKKLLDKTKTLDMIVIAGDFWGTKLSLNSIDAKYGIQFINEIFNICKENEIQIRMIRGTISHDYNQLDNFKYLEEDESGIFKIINKVETEKFEINNKTIRILYIPEEYLPKQEVFYEKYLNYKNKWDFVFGHGTFDFAAFSSQKIESEKIIKTAPILDSVKFSERIKGIGIFGHIHIKTNKDKIFYLGSFSRLNFGEEEPKGFYEIKYNIKTKEVKLNFIENILAPLYITIKLSNYFDKGLKFTEDNIELKINLIEKLKTKYKNSNLRIIDDTDSVTDLSTKILKEKYNYDEDIKLRIQKEKDKTEDRDDTYDFILERSLPINKCIRKFIKLKYNRKIPLEFIDKAIKEDTKEVNNEE